MDQAQLLRQACLDVQSTVLSTRERGEAQLRDLKGHPKPYEFCRQVLKDSTTTSTMRFHATQLMRSAIIRDWSRGITFELLSRFATFFWELLLRNPKEENLVREQLAQAVAVIIKLQFSSDRASDAATAGSNPWFDGIQPRVQAILEAPVDGMSIAPLSIFVTLRLFSTLIDELAWTKPTRTLTRSPEFHRECAANFQRQGHLVDVLSYCFKLLQWLCSDTPATSPSPQHLLLLSQCVHCIERILGWQFVPDRATVTPATTAKKLRPPEADVPAWRELLLSPNFRPLNLLFRAATQYFRDQNLFEQLVRCLRRFAALDRVFLQEDEALRTGFCRSYLQGLQRLLQLCNEHPMRISIVASLCHRYFGVRPASGLLVPTALTVMAQTTCKCVTPRGIQGEKTWKIEALEDLLSAWVSIVSEPSTEHSKLTEQLDHIYKTVVNSQLGGDPSSSSSSSSSIVVMAEDEEEDWLDEMDTHNELVVSLSVLGRAHCQSAMPFLIDSLRKRLDRVAQTSEGSDGRRSLQCDIYWLALVATQLLTDEVTGEEPEVPQAIEGFCRRFNKAKGVGELVNLMFRVGQFACQSMQRETATSASPTTILSSLERTFVQFAGRFVAAYVLRTTKFLEHEEAHYRQQAQSATQLVYRKDMSLVQQYQNEAEVQRIVKNLLAHLRFITSNRVALQNPDLIKDTMHLFRVMATTRDVPGFLVAHESFAFAQALVASSFATSSSSSKGSRTDFLSRFPGKARRSFIATLVLLTRHEPNVLEKIIKPLARSFALAVQEVQKQPDVLAPAMRKKLCTYVTCLRGVALGSTLRTVALTKLLCAQLSQPMLALLSQCFTVSPPPLDLATQLLKFVRDTIVFQYELVDEPDALLALATRTGGILTSFLRNTKPSRRPDDDRDNIAAILNILLQIVQVFVKTSSYNTIDDRTPLLQVAFRSFLTVFSAMRRFFVWPRRQSGDTAVDSESLLAFPKSAVLLFTVLCDLLTPANLLLFATRGSEDLHTGVTDLLEIGVENFNHVVVSKALAASTALVHFWAAQLKSHGPQVSPFTSSVQRIVYQGFHKAIFGNMQKDLGAELADLLFPLFCYQRGAAQSLARKLIEVPKDSNKKQALEKAIKRLFLQPEGGLQFNSDNQRRFRTLFASFLHFVRPVLC